MHERISKSTNLCVGAFDAGYSPVHGRRMAQHDIPTLLRKMMELLPANQGQLAERLSEKRRNGVKIDQSNISRPFA